MAAFSLEEVTAAFEKSQAREWRFFRIGAAVAACLTLLPAVLRLMLDHGVWEFGGSFFSRDDAVRLIAKLAAAGPFLAMIPALFAGVARDTVMLRCGKCQAPMRLEVVLTRGICIRCGEFCLKPPEAGIRPGVGSLVFFLLGLVPLESLIIFAGGWTAMAHKRPEMIFDLILPVNALLVFGLIPLSCYWQRRMPRRETSIAPEGRFYPDESVRMTCSRSDVERALKQGTRASLIFLALLTGLAVGGLSLLKCDDRVIVFLSLLCILVLLGGGAFRYSVYIKRNAELPGLQCQSCRRKKNMTDAQFWKLVLKTGRCVHCGRRLIFSDEADPEDS